MDSINHLTIQPCEGHRHSSRPAVLIVDDDSTLLALLTDALTQLGYNVFTAADGADVESVVRAQYAVLAIILIDNCMPRVSGVEVSRQLRANAYTADIPIVLMSAMPPTDISLFRSFLAKPFSLRTLSDCICKYQRTLPLCELIRSNKDSSATA